jgi:uncharacterized Tic20 family protein
MKEFQRKGAKTQRIFDVKTLASGKPPAYPRLNLKWQLMAENQVQPPLISPPPSTPPVSSPPPNPESQARMWNMLCHLSALAGFIGVPLGNILGPLIVWQIKKNEIPSVDIHGKAALNFQITVLIAGLVTAAAMFVGMLVCIGWLLLPVLILIVLAGLIFPIIAGINLISAIEVVVNVRMSE